MFSTIQVTPSLSPAFRSENRKTSLYGSISLNNLDIPNKRIVYCQVFLELWVEVDDRWWMNRFRGD